MHGQQFPCPAYLHCNGNFEVSRAMSCRIQGESVRPSVHPSTICPEPLSGWLRAGGRMDGRTDRRTDSRPRPATASAASATASPPWCEAVAGPATIAESLAHFVNELFLIDSYLAEGRKSWLTTKTTTTHLNLAHFLWRWANYRDNWVSPSILWITQKFNNFIKSSVLYAYYCKCILNLYVKAMR